MTASILLKLILHYSKIWRQFSSVQLELRCTPDSTLKSLSHWAINISVGCKNFSSTQHSFEKNCSLWWARSLLDIPKGSSFLTSNLLPLKVHCHVWHSIAFFPCVFWLCRLPSAPENAKSMKMHLRCQDNVILLCKNALKNRTCK